MRRRQILAGSVRQIHELSRTRVALKVPIIERNLYGLSSSSMLVTKSNFPEMELSESNLPLKTKVPISRQQVPSGISASPEKLTRSFVVCDQAAARGVGTGLSSGPVSRRWNDPAPLAFDSSIKFLGNPPMINITRQRPVNRVAGLDPAGVTAAGIANALTARRMTRNFILPNISNPTFF